MKARHPRPGFDFTIHSLARHRDIVAQFSRARFNVPSEDLIRERLWIYLDFLQEHGFTKRIIASKKDDISTGTVLQNSDLTDVGFRFVQSIEEKWNGRMLKLDPASKQRAFLEKWLAAFEKEET